MAQTGINIQISNTVMGAPPRVNSNTLLAVFGAKAETGGTMPFQLDTPYMVRSAEEAVTTLGLTEQNNAVLLKEVNDFYAPRNGLNNSGTLLWVVGTSSPSPAATTDDRIRKWVRKTVVNGFEYRPRILVFSPDPAVAVATQGLDPTNLQTTLDKVYADGFAVCAITAPDPMDEDMGVEDPPDLSKLQAWAVGSVCVTNQANARASVGATAGWLASLPVGTSIGDVSLGAFAPQMYLVDGVEAASGGTWTYRNTPVTYLTSAELAILGNKQYIFARTRPPQNGVYFNDGSTAADPATSLSTLENVRTIASIVDDLRSFLNPYINTRVPVSNNGDIDPTYRNVVEDNARAVVLQPYIDDGAISNGRVTIEALNGDFLGTRTWKVTVELLDAATLRWVDGYVFYVKSLE